MEIKTLEHYIVNLLEEKDEEIADIEAENGELLVELKVLRDKYNELRELITRNLEYKTYQDNKWYAFQIWDNYSHAKDFEFMEKEFGDLIKEDESKQGEEIRGDNKDSVSENS